MSGKRKETAIVIRQEKLIQGVYSMWLRTEITDLAKPGQFISLYCKDGSHLLPRPISICEIDREDHALRIVYRIAGWGTKEFSGLTTGMTVEIMGPSGNGFPLKSNKAFIIGGGIGIPPMLELAKSLDCEKDIVLGFKDKRFLMKEFEKCGNVYVATEDGSCGTKGNVLDAVRENGLEAQMIYACGPMPMLKALKEYAKEKQMECWISLEEKMACGIGACLACVCQTKHKDAHSNVHNKRICTEGPVFCAEEVEF